MRIIGLIGRTIDRAGHRGSSGAGKDVVAGALLGKHWAEQVNFADPIKRIVQDVYGFTDEQVWGSDKELEDERYPLPYEISLHERIVYLTSRHAQKTLGTEWARALCCESTWTLYMRRILELAQEGQLVGDRKRGYMRTDSSLAVSPPCIVISDVRFWNEVEMLRDMNAELWLIERYVDRDLSKVTHPSEVELKDFVPDPTMGDQFLYNATTIAHLQDLAHAAFERGAR